MSRLRPLAGRLVTRAPEQRDQLRADQAAGKLEALAPRRWVPPSERERGGQ